MKMNNTHHNTSQHNTIYFLKNSEVTGFKGIKGEVFAASNCPTDSKLFQFLTRGLLLRLGRQTKSNWGLDYKILHAILAKLELELVDAETWKKSSVIISRLVHF